jgi:hypothetical protein
MMAVVVVTVLKERKSMSQPLTGRHPNKTPLQISGACSFVASHQDSQSKVIGQNQQCPLL